MNKSKEKWNPKEREAFKILATIGGKASFKKNGKKGMSELGKKGAEKRWGNKSKFKK